MYNTDHFYPAKEDFFKKIYVIEEEENIAKGTKDPGVDCFDQ